MRSRKSQPEVKRIDIDDMNLSEAEKEHLQKLSGKQNGTKSSNPSVSQKVHEDTVNELKEKISGLESKLEEVKEDRTDIRNERDDYKKRFETKVEEIKKLTDDLDELKSNNRKLADKVTELENALKKKASETTVVRDDAEIERLNKEIKGLKDKLKDSEEQCESLASDNTALKTRIETMESEIRDIRNHTFKMGEEYFDSEPDTIGVVCRSTETRFDSDLFTERRYLVKLARNGHTISFTPDVEGSAICIDGGINLPRLKDLIPFNGITKYEALTRDGSEILVILD